MAAERLPLAQQSRFKYPGLLGFLVVLLVSFVDATIRLIRQSRRRSPGDPAVVALAGLLVGALSAFAFPIIVGAQLAGGSEWDLLYGLRWMGLRPAFLLPWTSPVGFLIALAAFVNAIRHKSWPRTTVSFCAVAVVAGALYLIMLVLNAQFQINVY